MGNYIKSVITPLLLLLAIFKGSAANYLCFTAEADNSEVWYVNEANNHPDMQYSTDGGASWTAWEANSHVTLPTVGSKVYIRGNNPNGFSHVLSMYTFVDLPELDCTYFKMKGSIAASGSVMSLIDGEGNTTVIPSGSQGCFFYLFGRCNVLTKAPELPATTLAEGCYNAMFYSCGLTEIPKLPATTLAEFCYGNMFMSCSKLKKKPVLPATTLATNCYVNMFAYTGLTEAPDLPATKLTYSCYAHMFREAKKLVKAPELKATELASYCYEGMFENCTSLTTAPELPSQTLVDGCYKDMFKNCTSLIHIKVGVTTLDNDVKATLNWVSGITGGGYFVFPCGSKYNKHGVSEVPDYFEIVASPIAIFVDSSGGELWRDTIGCDVLPTYKGPNLGEAFKGWDPEPTILTTPDVYFFTATYEEEEVPELDDWLCFTAEDPNACIFYTNHGGNKPNMQYSTDGVKWFDMVESGYCVNKVGDKVYIRGNNPDGFSHDFTTYSQFKTSGRMAVSGNVMSLIDGKGLRDDIPCEHCFYKLFEGTEITQAPTLPAVSLKESCYYMMFAGCENLTQAPVLPATELEEACYFYMFEHCTSLTSAPELPATELRNECYAHMFQRCESLVDAPELPATIMKRECYLSMFSGCVRLTQAPELPATILDERCYLAMFADCGRLERAPELPADQLKSGCYESMFSNCTRLNYIKVGVTTLGQGESTISWVENVTEHGIFVFPCGSKYNTRGEFAVPDNFDIISSPIVIFQNPDNSVVFQDTVCDVIPECPITPTYGEGNVFKGWDPEPSKVTEPGKVYYYTAMYEKKEGDPIPNNWLCFTAEVDESFVWYENHEGNNPDVQYSIDGGKTWQDLAPMQKVLLEKGGDKAYIKGNNPEGFSHGDAYTNFGLAGTITASGSVMSLIDGVGATDVIPCAGCFSHLFTECERLVSAPELPATTLSEACYWYMFDHCTLMEEAPKLPATQLEEACYGGMFSRCDNLIQAPELPAKEMKTGCYEAMFTACKKLTQAPKLPSTQLAEKCYRGMFNYCPQLKEAPELPATKMETGCYMNMFAECYRLIKAPELPSTQLADSCYLGMFSSCRILPQAPELPATQLKKSCYMLMFADCLTIPEAPELPATEMEERCYQSMFYLCQSITQAPKLPATILAEHCYEGMFRQCHSITQAPELPATRLTRCCYKDMFDMCSNLTKGPDLNATWLVDSCYADMFFLCENLNYIKVGVMTLDNEVNATTNWVEQIEGPGVFVFPCGSTYDKHGSSEVPINFEIRGLAYKTDSTIMAEDSFTRDGITYTESTSWTDSLETAFGCDSIINYNLVIEGLTPTPVVHMDTAACDVLVFKDVVYTKNASWNDTLQTTSGGDSIITYHLTVHKSVVTEENLTAEGSYTWKDITFTEDASWDDTLRTTFGCDSIVQYHLEIKEVIPIPATVTDIPLTACDSFVFEDVTYRESREWNDTLPAANGGDSIIAYHLTVHKSVVTEENLTAEGSYTWKDITFTESASWNDTLRTTFGCDSIVQYHLEIKEVTPISATVTDIPLTACDSFVFEGVTYRESREWNDTLPAANGGYSILAYHLILHKSVVTEKSITAEGSYTWKDITFAEDASWSDTLQTIFGCDSIVQYHLGIKEVMTDSATVTDIPLTACDSFVLEGVTYRESASWNDTLPAANGGDSILAYHLTIHKSVVTEENLTAEGSYTWKDLTFTESASWNDTLRTAFGCDSVVQYHLEIKEVTPISATVTDIPLSACDSFVFEGVTYRESREWNDTLPAANGGDSILAYHLTIHKSVVTEKPITAVDSYTWQGTTYTEDASWNDTLQTVFGCDSIVRYHLTIEKETPNLQLTVEDELYLVLPGGSETISYELTGGEGSKYEVRYNGQTISSGDVTNDSTVSLTCPSSLEPGAYEATLEMCDNEGNCAEKDFTFNVMRPDDKQKSFYVKVWNDVVICRNGGGVFQTFQWYKGREKCETASLQYFNDVALLDGEYMVFVTETSGKSYFIEPIHYDVVEATYTITAEPNVVAKGTEFTLKVSGVEPDELANARIVAYHANGVVEKILDEVEELQTMRLKPGEYVIVLTVNDGKNANCKVLVK